MLLAATPKLYSRSSTPTKRAVESMTLDVPSQAKRPRGEDPQMDVRSMTVAGIATSGTEDEDPAEYFVDHEDAGELQDPLVDNADTEEAMEAKLKELDRLAEFALCETVDLQVALGMKRVTTRWHTDHRTDGIRARFVARGFKGDEAMYDAFAPISTPSTGRIIDNLSLKKSHHTFTAHKTNAYFLVDEDVECYVDPQSEWLEQQAQLENPTLCHGDCESSCTDGGRAGTRCVDFMAEHLAEQSFDRCEAAPQFFLNYALHVSIGVHMDHLHGTGPKTALDLGRINLSQTIRFTVRTVYDINMRYEHLKRERVLHEDRTEIVPNPRYLRVVLHSMGLATCKRAPTPSVAGSVK